MFGLEKNCKNCKFGAFRKCLRGSNGEILDPSTVEPEEEGCDEYDTCIDHEDYIPEV